MPAKEKCLTNTFKLLISVLSGAFFLIIFTLLSNLVILASDNLIQNNSFQTNDVWEDYGGGSFEVTTDNIGKVKGTRSNYASGVKQKINILPNKDYKFSGKVRSDDPLIKGAKIRIAWYKEDTSSQLSTVDSNEVSSNFNEWQEVFGTVVSPNEASIVEIRLLTAKLSGDYAIAYFDDIVFEELAASSPSPSLDPSPSIQASVTYPINIFLSEFMPYPEQGSEWVEIFNNNDSKVVLSDWQLDDIEDGSAPESFSVDVEAFKFKVVYFSSNKLNNGGDSLRLIRPDGQVVDQTSYLQSTKGKTWSKVSGLWCLAEPTIESSNGSCIAGDQEEETEDLNPSCSSSASVSPSISLDEDGVGDASQSGLGEDQESEDQATDSGFILGVETVDKLDNQEGEGGNWEENNNNSFLALVISLSGLMFLGAAAIPLIKPKLNKLKKFFGKYQL